MKEFAVGYLNYFDNELIIEVICAENWHSALMSHSKLKSALDDEFSLTDTSLEDAKMQAFNCDMAIDVIEI